MRFVPIKSADQQALLMLHRTRDLLIRQRTQLINALRAHLAEFGLVAATGREGLAQLAAIITDESNREALPSAMKQALQALVDQTRCSGIANRDSGSRHCAAAAFDGGQGAARRHLQARRSLSPTVARHRCNSRCSTRPAAAAKASLGHEAAGQEAGQARRRCRCQQDGAHRLGDHGQGRILSSAGACCSRLKRLGNGSLRRRRSKTTELRG
jgi:hypothetical protein